MLRIGIATLAVALSLGLAGAPVASAGTCYGNGTACVKDPRYAPTPEQRREAAKRISDPLGKAIADCIKKALGINQAPAAAKPKAPAKAKAPDTDAKPKAKPAP